MGKGSEGSRAFLAASKQRSRRIFYPQGSFPARQIASSGEELTRFSATEIHVSLFSQIGLSGGSYKIVILHLFPFIEFFPPKKLTAEFIPSPNLMIFKDDNSDLFDQVCFF